MGISQVYISRGSLSTANTSTITTTVVHMLLYVRGAHGREHYTVVRYVLV